MGKIRRNIISAVLFFVFVAWQTASFAAENCFAIYGDSRTGHQAHQRIVDQITKNQPEAVFNIGDLVEDGNDAALWMIFDRITAKLRAQAPMYPVMGNHDKQSKLFFDEFNLPDNKAWYSVSTPKIHFIVLDSTSSLTRNSEQYKWFEIELESAKKNKFIVVLLHQPIFTVDQHRNDNINLEPLLCPLFEKYAVSMVFSGHSHNYQRYLHMGVIYVVTGGGGAPLYDKAVDDPTPQIFIKEYHFCRLCVVNNKLVLTVFSVDGKVIDQLELIRK